MAASARDTSFLEMHNGKWRVVVAVPKHLQPPLKSKLKKGLKTDSLSQANRVKWGVIRLLRAEIEKVERELATKTTDALGVAKLLRRSRHEVPTEVNHYAIAEVIDEWQDKLRGKPITYITEHDDVTGAPIKVGVYDPDKEAIARKFREIAMELGTPVDEHHQEYMKTLVVTYRTRADDTRSLQYLREWCDLKKVPFTLEALRSVHAIEFCKKMGPADESPNRALQIVEGTNLDPVTRKKYLTRLTAYWTYLVDNEKTNVNIWSGCKISIPKKPQYVKERLFTNDEVRRLLMGPAKQAMQDLMRIAALTGARIEAIVSLKVGDTAEGAFTFAAMKTETSDRDIPIHPDLQEIVDRRSKGKKPTDDFFPEWPPVKKVDSMRERSFKASNQFTDYRRLCKVDDMYVRVKIAPDGSRHYDKEPIGEDEGKSGLLKLRRSRVNFHSFRRWFITRMEQAGVSPALVSAMVGHARQGTTLKIYSGGPEFEQAKQGLALLKLPALTNEPAPEPRALRRVR